MNELPRWITDVCPEPRAPTSIRPQRLLALSILALVVGITTSQSIPVDRGVLGLTAASVTPWGYLEDAKSVTEAERKRIITERDAFDQFARRVKSISASNGDRAAPPLIAGGGRSDVQQLREVRDAYRDTVMSVPHYEEEYGESLRENLAAEFDDHVATALADGRQFSPLLKNTVFVKAASAKRSREKLAKALERELTSLRNARDRLRERERALERTMKSESELYRKSMSTLIEYEEVLHREEGRSEDLLADRQREIHRENRSFSRSSKLDLQQYLYSPLDVTYPVLSAGTERIRRIREQRRTVQEAMTDRRGNPLGSPDDPVPDGNGTKNDRTDK